MDFVDKSITCVDCRSTFTFTAGEQRWYHEKGFEREPRRCPDCRKSRKSEGGGGGGGGRGGRSSRPRFQATCAGCGGVAEVPFEPRPGAPVYCSTCFQARRG